MEQIGNISVLFIAGFGPIVREATASRKLYNQVLGIGLKEEKGGYLHTGSTKFPRHRLGLCRFITPEGLLVGITFTPSMREER